MDRLPLAKRQTGKRDVGNVRDVAVVVDVDVDVDDNPGESKSWVAGGLGVGRWGRGVSNPSAAFVAAQITVGHNCSLLIGYSHTFIQRLEHFVSTFCQI